MPSFTPISWAATGKVAVVTGAASGIGRAIAHRFVAEGGQVVGGDVNVEGLNALAGELGEAFVGQRCDVVAEADVAALVATAAERFGGLHAAFNVAGASRPGLLVDLSEEDWDFTVDLCLKGVFFGVKHAGRQMIAQGGGGAIVNIASLNSRVPMFFGGAYSAAKAGVVSIGQTGALELAEHRHPRLHRVAGAHRHAARRRAHRDRGGQRGLSPAHPTGRAASPDDIASAALYLASDDAGYISGVNLFVDGAWEQTGYPDLRPIFSQHHGQRGDGALVMRVVRARRWAGARRHLRGPSTRPGLRPARIRPQRSRRVRRPGDRVRAQRRCSMSDAAPERSRACSLAAVSRDGRRSGLSVARRGARQARRRCGGLATRRRDDTALARRRRRVHDRQRRPGLPHRRRLGRRRCEGSGRALRPGGMLVFETRDPARRAWEQWTPELTRTVVDIPAWAWWSRGRR